MSEFDPVDITPATSRSASNTLAELPEDEPSSSAGSRGEREGLPTSYRMRAEGHYVDELTRPSRAPRPTAPEIADQPDSADEPDSGERQRRILDQVGEGLRSIESATALLSGQGASGAPRRVAVDLILAEARRAAWLLRAGAVLDDRHPRAARPRPLGAVLAAIRDTLAVECRLAGVSLQVQASDPQAQVTVDDESLTTGVSGAVLATLGLIGSEDGAVIRVTAVALGGELRTVEVRQDVVPVDGAVRRRFFDVSHTDRPGGWLAALGAEVARASAQRHGGDAILITKDRRGSTIRMTLSRLG